MTARAWFAKTVGLTILLVIAIAAINADIDIYGIFRNPENRHLPGYGDDRVAKYLLSEKYVPTNFNGLVIGSSVSANWDISHIDAFRMYNESLNGGNIVEEKTIVDQALANPRIKLAIVVVHPFLTSSHDFETVHVTPRENLGALGSQNLLDAYKGKVGSHFHKNTQSFDESGVFLLEDTHREMNAALRKVMDSNDGFKIDPIALQANRDLVAELHAAKIPIVFVIPPLSQTLLAPRQRQLNAYSTLILEDKGQSDKVIDFSSPDFDAFRRNEANFVDGVHLTSSGARELVAEINEQLNDWLRTGQLLSDTDSSEKVLSRTAIFKEDENNFIGDTRR